MIRKDVEKTQKKFRENIMKKIELQASNIKCAGCVSNIKDGLKDINGINEINVDIDSNVVSLAGSEMNPEEIKNKLTELGYPTVSD